MSLELLRRLFTRGPVAYASVLAVIGFGLSLALARQAARIALDDEIGRSAAARLPSGIVDPETTGSIGPSSVASAAKSVSLDPCDVPGRVRQRLIVRGP